MCEYYAITLWIDIFEYLLDAQMQYFEIFYYKILFSKFGTFVKTVLWILYPKCVCSISGFDVQPNDLRRWQFR